jgi:hypothetical protein
MTENTTVSITLRIIVHDPPDILDDSNIVLTLEDARKNLHDGVPGEDGSLRFELSVTVRRQKGGTEPDFFGPYVSGPIGQRFIYMNWSKAGPKHFGTVRRIKVPLKSITWELIEQASDSGLTARIDGVGKDGTPACATVPLLDGGWTTGVASL